MTYHKFYGQGSIDVKSHDFVGRSANLFFTIPCVIFQSFTDCFIKHGVVKNLRIATPFAVWIPPVKRPRIKPEFDSIPDAENQINSAIRMSVENTLATLNAVKGYLTNEDDIIPLLPLGTYINFDYKISVDNCINLMEDINNSGVSNTFELRIAIAEALNSVLSDFATLEINRLISKGK